MAKFFLIVLLMVSGCTERPKSDEKVYEKEEIVQFRDLDGGPVHLSSFKGQRILVNYWATWCIPCRVEFPSLVSAQEKLKDENYVFLFPTPDDVEMILKFQEQKKYPFRYLTMEESLANMNVGVLPSTVIYSSDGKEHKRLRGAHEWDSQKIISLLKQVP